MKSRKEEVEKVVAFLDENGFKKDSKRDQFGFSPLLFFKIEEIGGPICDCNDRNPQLLCFVYDDDRVSPVFKFNMWAQKNNASYEVSLCGYDSDMVEDILIRAKRSFEAGWKELDSK